VAQYERGMAPAEQKIAGKLRQQLSDLSAKSHQVQSVLQYFTVHDSIMPLTKFVT